MNELDIEFLNKHDVLQITTTASDVYSPYFTIEYVDGKQIKGDTYHMDYE